MSTPLRQYIVKTPHYKYILRAKELYAPFHQIHYIVGNTKTPCLEASVHMDTIPDTYSFLKYEGQLYKIDALKECMYESPNTNTNSFGIELLYSFINILKANHPYLKTLKLQDSSFIPCHREDRDTLDLLIYNIALQGKTWYEAKAGARLYHKKFQATYDKQIKEYMEAVPKDEMTFDDMYRLILRNTFAANKIHPYLGDVERDFNNAKSYPDFFKLLNNRITRQEKCRFFKDWLESFIGMRINIHRDWEIHLVENPVLGDVLNVSAKRSMRPRKTRRRYKIT